MIFFYNCFTQLTTMYLFINPSGVRHILCKTFKQVLKLMVMSKDDVEYRYTVLDTDTTGSYDMLISRITETVSKKQYVKARFIFNPTNNYMRTFGEGDFVPRAAGLFGAMMGSSFHPSQPKEKAFDALTLLPESLLVNGFLPLETDIGDSVLDDFKTLTATLDDFFNPPPKVAKPTVPARSGDSFGDCIMEEILQPK